MNTIGINLTNRLVVLKETEYGGTEEERKFLCETGFGLMPFTHGAAITGRRLLNDQMMTIDAEKDIDSLWVEPELRGKGGAPELRKPEPPPVFRDAKADDQIDWPAPTEEVTFNPGHEWVRDDPKKDDPKKDDPKKDDPKVELEEPEMPELPGILAATDATDAATEELNSTEPTSKKPKQTKDDDSDHSKRKRPRR